MECGTAGAKEGANINPMKISFKLTVLLAVATFPVAAFAQSFGAKVPAPFQLESAASVFALLLIGLTLFSDYSRRPRPLRAPVSSPCNRLAGETHRLAA